MQLPDTTPPDLAYPRWRRRAARPPAPRPPGNLGGHRIEDATPPPHAPNGQPETAAPEAAEPVASGVPWRGRGPLPAGMLVLWLVEVLVCSMLFYVPLAAGPSDAAPNGMQLRAANQALLLALTFGLTSVAIGLYSPRAYLCTRGLLADTAIGVLLASPALWLVGYAASIDLAGLSMANPRHALQAVVAWTLFLCALRLSFSYAVRTNLFVRRVLIVGADEGAGRLAAAIGSLRRGAFEVVEAPPADSRSRRHGSALWGIIVTGEGEGGAWHIHAAREQGLRLYSGAEFWERELQRIDVDQVPAGSCVAGATRHGRFDAAVQRLNDIVLSLSLLVLTLPLMLLTALLVAIESPGGALYRQERVGLNGRVFTLLKFRSMRADAEARGPVWAEQRDSRVTRVGAFIRLVRIDELPQLINVLRGEMSFIGPRPERPHFVAQLERVLPCYQDRAQVKPGLTGWAQVNYPYGASVEDARAKLAYDLYYVKHRSLALDLRILLATVRVVLFQCGAR